MKRLWIAAALLAFLLGASLANAWYSQSLTGDMTDRLRQAQSLAEGENWDQAEAVTRQVYEDWQDHHFYLHTLMRHSDTDQVLRAFRQASMVEMRLEMASSTSNRAWTVSREVKVMTLFSMARRRISRPALIWAAELGSRVLTR